MLWVKDMDQLTTSSVYNSWIYEYRVSKNGDFGTAVGYDLTLELRGEYFNSTVQYTYSTAKASSEYDDAAFGSVAVDAPMQEFLMPYDRTHDLTMSLYTKKLPWGVTSSLRIFSIRISLHRIVYLCRWRKSHLMLKIKMG